MAQSPARMRTRRRSYYRPTVAQGLSIVPACLLEEFSLLCGVSGMVYRSRNGLRGVCASMEGSYGLVRGPARVREMRNSRASAWPHVRCWRNGIGETPAPACGLMWLPTCRRAGWSSQVNKCTAVRCEPKMFLVLSSQLFIYLSRVTRTRGTSD